MPRFWESENYEAIPRNAIATGLVEHVPPAEAISAKLLEYAAYLSSLNAKPSDIREEIGSYLGWSHGFPSGAGPGQISDRARSPDVWSGAWKLQIWFQSAKTAPCVAHVAYWWDEESEAM